MSLIMLRTHLGHNLDNDQTLLWNLTGTRLEEAQNFARAIRDLIKKGFLIPTNQQVGYENSGTAPEEVLPRVEESRVEESRVERLRTPEEEESEMPPLAKTIQAECIKLLGIHDRLFDDTKESLKMLANAYGKESVIDAFRSWAESVAVYPPNYPISVFIKYAPEILRCEVVLKPDPVLTSLCDWVAGLTQNEMIFNPTQKAVVKKLVEEFTEPVVRLAVRQFYSDKVTDDYSRKFAVRNFLEQADTYCRGIVRNRERDKAIADFNEKERTRQQAEVDQELANRVEEQFEEEL